MQKIFDRLIDSFIDTRVGIAENFLSGALADNLVAHLRDLYSEKLLLTGGTGNEQKPVHDKLLRSDIIYWLDRKHDNPYENEFLTLIEDEHHRMAEKGSFMKISRLTGSFPG